jgi:hypothetical protein
MCVAGWLLIVMCKSRAASHGMTDKRRAGDKGLLVRRALVRGVFVVYHIAGMRRSIPRAECVRGTKSIWKNRSTERAPFIYIVGLEPPVVVPEAATTPS